ncbi:MAG: DNA-processing protein DprA [Lachnospiraceae bacterium]|nr:DNA-processing protein DprA [Lachnospiraceae bacterium]
MMNEKIYVNWLYHVPGIGRTRLKELLGMGATAEEICKMSPTDLMALWEKEKRRHIGPGGIKKIEEFKREITPVELWNRIRDKGITMLTLEDDAYPRRLKETIDAPPVLYRMGKGSEESTEEMPSVSVVGSRICSEYGRMVASRIGKECVARNISLVSGMAVGIDGIAQGAALEAGGCVSAVLGSGADVCYPKENEKLYVNLLKKGMIYSEYVPGTQPKPQNFPPRNRIISGLSDAVIVVEAKEKSGTMITVDMALEQGRQVYIIPGRLTDPLSAGCNRLIGQGAEIVWNLGQTLDRIASEYYLGRGQCERRNRTRPGEEIQNKNEEKECKPKLSRKEQIVFDALDLQPSSLQEIYERIAESSDIAFSELSGILLEMDLKGLVKEQGGRYSVCFFFER